MTIRSPLEPFSLPELFREIGVGKKSGRLIVKTIPNNETLTLKGIYFIWFHHGYIIGFSDRINCRGLIELIENLNWLSPVVTQKLRIICPPRVPLGRYLYQKKLLTKEQLSFIFQLQLHQLYKLFKIESGQFQFDELWEIQDRLFTIPWLEMTGHRIKTIEASMYALRLIDNWQRFQEYIPAPMSGIRSLVNQPEVKLSPLEQEIWQFADGNISLTDICPQNRRIPL